MVSKQDYGNIILAMLFREERMLMVLKATGGPLLMQKQELFYLKESFLTDLLMENKRGIIPMAERKKKVFMNLVSEKVTGNTIQKTELYY